MDELKIIDLDDKLLDKSGKSELNEKQKKDLKGLYTSVDNDVNIASKLLHRGKTGSNLRRRYNNNKNNAKNILIIVLIATLIGLTPFIYNLSNNELRVTTNLEEQYKGSVINITMNNEDCSLVYNVKNISISTDNCYINLNNFNWLGQDLKLSKDTYNINDVDYTVYKETKLSLIDISKSKAYIQYMNSNNTGCRELIFNNNIPASLDLSLLKKSGERYFEYIGHLENKVYTKSYENTFLMLTEKISGGELVDSSLKNNITNIEGKMTKSFNDEACKIVIELDEIGTIDLSTIDGISASPQIVYDKSSDILRLRNMDENIDYVYIFGINNEIMQSYVVDFIETNHEKLLVHKCYDNENSIGYKTFMLKTDNNLYCIKLNNIAHEALQKQLFKQLGIDIEQIEVKTIQSVVPYSIERE